MFSTAIPILEPWKYWRLAALPIECISLTTTAQFGLLGSDLLLSIHIQFSPIVGVIANTIVEGILRYRLNTKTNLVGLWEMFPPPEVSMMSSTNLYLRTLDQICSSATFSCPFSCPSDVILTNNISIGTLVAVRGYIRGEPETWQFVTYRRTQEYIPMLSKLVPSHTPQSDLFSCCRRGIYHRAVAYLLH